MIEKETTTHISFEPAEELVIDDLETLKVLADPLRLKMLELLAKPRTVKKIAQILDIPPTKLYYHINLLEKQGLIQTVDTRIVSGIIEKHYQITAKVFVVEKGLLSPGTPEFDDHFDITLSTLFDNIKAEIKESAQRGVIDESDNAPECLSLNIFQGVFRLTQAQAEEFHQRMQALINEYADLRDHPENENAQVFRLLNVLYPSIERPADAADSSQTPDS